MSLLRLLEEIVVVNLVSHFTWKAHKVESWRARFDVEAKVDFWLTRSFCWLKSKVGLKCGRGLY